MKYVKFSLALAAAAFSLALAWYAFNAPIPKPATINFELPKNAELFPIRVVTPPKGLTVEVSTENLIQFSQENGAVIILTYEASGDVVAFNYWLPRDRVFYHAYAGIRPEWSTGPGTVINDVKLENGWFVAYPSITALAAIAVLGILLGSIFLYLAVVALKKRPAERLCDEGFY